MLFDALVVGGGPSGTTAATALATRWICDVNNREGDFSQTQDMRQLDQCAGILSVPYLKQELRNLVGCPFYGIRFYDHELARHGTYNERKASGYLTFRSK